MVSSTMLLEVQLDVHMQKKNNKTKLDTDLKPFTKINLKWITNINVKCKTTNLLEDNMGESLDDFGYGDDFSDTTTIAWSMK